MKNLFVAAIVAGLVACGGNKNVRGPGGVDDSTPAWVAQGSGAFSVESGKKIQGVGQSRSPDLKGRRQSADSGAQRQLTGSVDALSAALAKMTESTKVNVGDDISAIARKTAQASAQARDHYVSSDGAESALAQIDLGAFKQALQSADGDDGIKKEMASNVDRAFDQLAKQ
jgi:hypothetical protein